MKDSILVESWGEEKNKWKWDHFYLPRYVFLYSDLRYFNILKDMFSIWFDYYEYEFTNSYVISYNLIYISLYVIIYDAMKLKKCFVFLSRTQKYIGVKHTWMSGWLNAIILLNSKTFIICWYVNSYVQLMYSKSWLRLLFCNGNELLPQQIFHCTPNTREIGRRKTKLILISNPIEINSSISNLYSNSLEYTLSLSILNISWIPKWIKFISHYYNIISNHNHNIQ